MGFWSKWEDVREALFSLEMAQNKSDKGFQGLPLLMKSHVHGHLLGREGSSCEKIVNKDWETLTNKMENEDKEKILLGGGGIGEWHPKTISVAKEGWSSTGGGGCWGHTCFSSQEGKQQGFWEWVFSGVMSSFLLILEKKSGHVFLKNHRRNSLDLEFLRFRKRRNFLLLCDRHTSQPWWILTSPALGFYRGCLG